MRLITLGPQGTFGEEAAKLFHQRISPEIQPDIRFSTVPGCLREIERFQVERGILPAENMLDGIIGATFDALIDFHDSIKICDEVHLPVDLVLASNPSSDLSEIQMILSHPSPLAQCQHKLTKLIPNAFHQPTESTAAAACIVKDQPGKAAICSQKTAKDLGLKILTGNISDFPLNETRFLVCGLSDSPPTGNDRTMLAVRFGANRPGQLHEVTGILSKQEIDLQFVQSRPYKIRPQDYVLLFELVGHKNDTHVEEALKQIEVMVRKTDGWKKVLGSFPRRQKGE